MNDFRRALLQAEQDMLDPVAVARARRRVAARLDAAGPEPPSRLRRWAPAVAAAACVASALALYAVIAEDELAVTPVAEPAAAPVRSPVRPPVEPPPRPGFAARPPIPTVQRQLPPAPTVAIDDGRPQGTLVAIAIGGSCSWTVDGERKGTGSSIRVSVPLGSHTVTCTPPGRATRSQSLNVKGGKPSIASFRFD